MAKVNAFWDRTQNFGDKLAPWLIQRITGIAPLFSAGSSTEPVLVTCGSLLNVPVAGAVVWGAGFARCTDPVAVPAKVCAVRGPRSREKLLAYGVDCPDVCADPATLLPRFVQPASQRHRRLAVIPHYADYHIAAALFTGLPVDVVDLMGSIEGVIEQVTRCDLAVSSSLHGMIVAHAYGIPCRWVRFSDKVEGCGFKFHDYFASGGLPLVNPLDLTIGRLNLAELESTVPRKLPVINTEALWAARPSPL